MTNSNNPSANLTVSRIREKKQGLEQSISELIRQFESETGTVVTSLEFNRSSVLEWHRSFGEFTLHCKIEI